MMIKHEKRNAKIRSAAKKRRRMEEGKDGKTGRSMTGTWTKRNNTSHFGNMLYAAQETDHLLITEFVVIIASMHT